MNNKGTDNSIYTIMNQSKVLKVVDRNRKKILKKIVSSYHRKYTEETRLWLKYRKCIYKINKRKQPTLYRAKPKAKAQKVLRLILIKIFKYCTLKKKKMKKCRPLDCSVVAKTSIKKKIMKKTIK